MTSMDTRRLMIGKLWRALLRSPWSGLRYLRESREQLRRGPGARRRRPPDPGEGGSA